MAQMLQSQPSLELGLGIEPRFPAQALAYPEFRYMGSKHRLMPWIHSVLSNLKFETAADPFSGSGCVSYLMKSMGKSVSSSDFLAFPSVISTALTVNQSAQVTEEQINYLCAPDSGELDFVQRTFEGIFFTHEDLKFVDTLWHRLPEIEDTAVKSLVLTALIRSAMKKQPRGVFTVGNLPDGSPRYNDGRRDVRLSLREHFIEQIQVMNRVVFDGPRCWAEQRDAILAQPTSVDLVYLDPPYVPRSDDNCYIKRYHFLEGLATYWKGMSIMESSKVKKLKKKPTPFSHRSSSIAAFRDIFRAYADSTIVLSYSSNGFPDLDVLVGLMKEVKRTVEVDTRSHRYHFGTHKAVQRSEATEYLIVGTS